jgi:membrane protein YdbS with pleckstrin-like domain
VAFPRRLLIDGEDLVLELRPHWIALVVPVFIAVVIVGGWIAELVYAPDDDAGRSVVVWGATGVAVVLLVIYSVRRIISWATSYFVVTSDRVIHREGWIAKRSMEIPLEAINDVRFHQGVFERMIGAGDLIISSASEFGRQVFGDIRNPEEVQKTIYHQGELNKERMFRGGRSAETPAGTPPPASTPAAASTTGELERLAELRDRGVLTEAEFQNQKKKVLGDP